MSGMMHDGSRGKTFEFATAGRIIFGRGTAGRVATEAAEKSGRVFVVTGSDASRASELIGQIGEQGCACEVFPVSGEPSVELVDSAVTAARGHDAGCVVSVGGGSVIDTGKAVAAMLTNRGELLDYLEVVGRGEPLTERPKPCIAVPTTAGTGAEVTRNSVLAVPEKKVKVSMRSPLMLPSLAVVDPVLTLGLPPGVTASSGMDALTQLIEAYVSRRANPLTDSLCREGIGRAARSLENVYQVGADIAAREDMALASLFSGLALANAGLGAVHGIAGPLGGMTGAPHGAVCARLLPFVIEANLKALSGRSPHSPALARYAEIGEMLTGSFDAGAGGAVRRAHELVSRLNIPGLGSLGLRKKDIGKLVDKAGRSSSMKGNPVELDSGELHRLIEAAI